MNVINKSGTPTTKNELDIGEFFENLIQTYELPYLFVFTAQDYNDEIVRPNSFSNIQKGRQEDAMGCIVAIFKANKPLNDFFTECLIKANI